MAWTHQQSVHSISEVVAFGSNVHAGALLLVSTDGAATTTPTDTLSTTYSLIRGVITANSQNIYWWWGIAPSGGADTVTLGSGQFQGIIISEFTVDAGTISLDDEDTVFRAGIGSGTDVLTGTAMTASANGSLALSMVGSDDAATEDLNAGTGFTLRAQGILSSSSTDRIALESAEVNTGSVTPLWSPTGTFQGQVHGAIFKAAVSAADVLTADHGMGMGRW